MDTTTVTQHYNSLIEIPWYIGFLLSMWITAKIIEIVLRIIPKVENWLYTSPNLNMCNGHHRWEQYDSQRSHRCVDCGLILDGLTEKVMTAQDYDNLYRPTK